MDVSTKVHTTKETSLAPPSPSGLVALPPLHFMSYGRITYVLAMVHTAYASFQARQQKLSESNLNIHNTNSFARIYIFLRARRMDDRA